MKRSVWFWVCFALAVVLAVYFSVRIIMTGMGHGNVARVQNISIKADVNNKDLSALVAAASVAPGTNTYSVNLDNLNARVLAVPGVKDAAVRRMPNGNLSVKVSLYKPIALWTDGQHFYPLSADGTIVNKPTDARNIGNVVFQGKVPNDIQDITKAVHNLIGDLDYLEWIENRRWNLHTMGGIVVMLPEANPIEAVGTLVTLNKNYGILHKAVNVIDMRDAARVLIK
ncbi:MAG: cell division protein FtsQ/DivIB [Alphaproteobacteria bacterium]|nr:cell division protein FtsQ/DivIB [Alphaproteobacteria bacterium]